MAYYTKVLLPDERVRAVGQLHWAIFLRSWTCLAIGVGAAIATLFYRGGSVDAGAAANSALPTALAAVAVIFLGMGAVLGMGAWIRRATTEIVVTDRRVIYKVGFVRRRTMEMNMTKVETVDVVQSIAGRVFNYGTLLIRGTGSSYEPLVLVADPLALRTAIVAQ